MKHQFRRSSAILRRAGGVNTPMRRPRGYTLLEIVVALPVMAMLLLGLGSAVKIAAQAVPNGTTTPSATLSARELLDLITTDLTYATTINTDVTQPGAANQLQFNLAQSNGSLSTTCQVQYNWPGTAGTSFQRQFNGQQTTLPNVQEFTLAYDKKAVALPTTYSTSATMLLFSSDGSGAFSTNDNSITTTNWVGEYFQPVLASNVYSWNVTSASIYLKQTTGPPNGINSIQIRTAAGGVPTSTVLAQQSFPEGNLTGNYTYNSISFPPVPYQSPATGLCLVVACQNNSPSCLAQSYYGATANSNCVSTTNAGSSWQNASGQSLSYYIYGTVQTPNPTTYQYLLTGIRCTLRLGNGANSRLSTTIRVLNQPVVKGP